MSFERSEELKAEFPVPTPQELGLGVDEDLWVFGYGSLMWAPGFPHVESLQGIVDGYHRSFCVTSHRYRGTVECPGLVLGLDGGGSCHGMIFRVIPADLPQTLVYLWDREMISGVYEPRRLPIQLVTPRSNSDSAITALTFVVRPEHVQYAGHLTEEETVEIILHARGQRGACSDYLTNTVAHLDAMGIQDQTLSRLMELVESNR